MFDAPWLDGALQRFDARLARGHTPQALLVHGPAGIGRRHFSLALAGRLLGEDWHSPLNEPVDLRGFRHPDYRSIGLDDESSVIKVDQVRDLTQALNLTSHRHGWKVGLVWPADALNHNAANTLLKTLEEPPPATTLFLVAEAPSRLPATITSRCERLRLCPPSQPAALAWLVARHPDRTACERALAFASGAPLAALALLGEAQDSGVSRVLGELAGELQQLIDRRIPPTTLAPAWARRDAGVCLRWLYLQTAELMRQQVRLPDDPGSPLLPLKIANSNVNMAACCAYLEQIMEAGRLKDRSLNMEVMFAELLMWWYGAAGTAR